MYSWYAADKASAYERSERERAAARSRLLRPRPRAADLVLRLLLSLVRH